MDQIELGDLVKDAVTGFEGVVIGITTFLHGCTRVGVQSRTLKDDGTLRDSLWFDEPQLVLKKKAVVPSAQANKTTAAAASSSRKGQTGGPMVSIPTRNMPR